MSIESISQGNYILQGTVATSAGIVGDGTTQNPLRADETVLFDTTAVNGVGVCNLSESLKNFERIAILGTRGYNSSTNPDTNGGTGPWTFWDCDKISADGQDYHSVTPFIFEGYNWKNSCYSADPTFTTLTWYRGITKNMTSTAAGTTANSFTGCVGIRKVIGVNRIGG